MTTVLITLGKTLRDQAWQDVPGRQISRLLKLLKLCADVRLLVGAKA